MKKGNCPYCGSSNCMLGMNDFFGKKKQVKIAHKQKANTTKSNEARKHNED